MKNRIKEIRKGLNLTQQEFADRLGIKRNTIATYETGRNTPIDAVISLICREFKINEEWLRNGTGSMFIVTPSSAMEQLKKEFNLDDFSYHLVYEYLKLEPAQKNIVNNFLQSIMKEDEMAYNDISSETCSVEEAEEAYIKSRLRPAKKTEQSALNTTDDTTKHDEAVNQ